MKSGPSPEALRGRGNEKKKVAFIVWNWDTIHLLYYFLQIKWSPKVFKILSSNFWDCKGRVHVVQVSKLLSHPNSLRLGENSVHSSSHESHKRRSDGFEKMQKKSEKFRPNCDSISPVHRRNLGVCSWLTPWVPNIMSRLILRFYVLVCRGLFLRFTFRCKTAASTWLLWMRNSCASKVRTVSMGSAQAKWG